MNLNELQELKASLNKVPSYFQTESFKSFYKEIEDKILLIENDKKVKHFEDGKNINLEIVEPYEIPTNFNSEHPILRHAVDANGFPIDLV